MLGSMGPGTKLPTLGHTEYAVHPRRLRGGCTRACSTAAPTRSSSRPARTCCSSRPRCWASRRAMAQFGRDIPVIAHVTVETTGTMLLGSEIGAALTALEPLGIDMIGLNCATGPAEMSEHLRHLSKHAQMPVSVMPNAGLPVLGAERRRIPADARRTRRGAVAASSPSSASRWSAAAAAPRPNTSARSPRPSRTGQRAERNISLRAGGVLAVHADAVRAGRLGPDDR